MVALMLPLLKFPEKAKLPFHRSSPRYMMFSKAEDAPVTGGQAA